MSNGFPPSPPGSPAPPPFVPPPSPARAVPAARKPSALLPLLVVASLALSTVVIAVATAGLIIYTDRGGWSRPGDEDPGPVGPGPSGDAPAPAAESEPLPEVAPPPAPDPPEAQPAAAAVERPEVPASEVERGQRAAGDAAATTSHRGRRAGTVGSTLGEAPEPPPPPPPPAPIRVGGQIRQPAKIHDVRPAYPDIAQRARVQGTVIIEATIGKDGTIEEARVLRSIPLLDDAALQAVRQWRYEPTYLNGEPVPVIVTVTVQFTLR